MAERTAEETGPIEASPVGIGGWLLLPALGLILGLILGAVFAFNDFVMLYSGGLVKYSGLDLMEIVVELSVFGYLIYAALRFFTKRSDAPSIMIVLLILGFAVPALLLMIETIVGAQDYARVTAKQLPRGLISAAVWIPYFRTSKRVRATFVN